MKRKIEIFTDGCPVCNPVVDMVKSMATEEYNDVVVYNLAELRDNSTYLVKVDQYGIKRLPAVAVDGSLLACCNAGGVTKEDLFSAGVGINA